MHTGNLGRIGLWRLQEEREKVLSKGLESLGISSRSFFLRGEVHMDLPNSQLEVLLENEAA